MGLKVKFWDISMHTVPEVVYDGRYHMYDSSLSALYTLCDGKTIAGVEDIGAEGACPASGGKSEPGHIARYHCLNATSPNGFLSGCDTMRSLAEEYHCFNPRGLKYRYYFNNWDLGHRYILNLREGEAYTRYYHRLDEGDLGQARPAERQGYRSDPAYYVPNEGKDPEAANPRYRIRGNGIRTWTPPLTAAGLAAKRLRDACRPRGAARRRRAHPGRPTRRGGLQGRGGQRHHQHDDPAPASFGGAKAIWRPSPLSTTNGLQWKEVWKADKTGEIPLEIQAIDEVNGAYEVLVKVRLLGKAAAADARLQRISFETVTMLNSKTQPKLRLGKNTVYVGAGDQTESTVLWPDLEGRRYKPYVVEEKNVKTAPSHPDYMGTMFAEKGREEAYVVFKLECARPIRRITYGGRLYNRGQNAHIDLLHSFDGGKTWTQSYSLTDTTPPWDVIHYERVDNVPAGARSVLVQVSLERLQRRLRRVQSLRRADGGRLSAAERGFQAYGGDLHLERAAGRLLAGDAEPHATGGEGPFTYAIDVGGADHPVVESLRLRLADGEAGAAPVKYGYSDGKDVGGEKFRDRWVTYGKNLAEGKPYTCSVPSRNGWGAGDPRGQDPHRRHRGLALYGRRRLPVRCALERGRQAGRDRRPGQGADLRRLLHPDRRVAFLGRAGRRGEGPGRGADLGERRAVRQPGSAAFQPAVERDSGQLCLARRRDASRPQLPADPRPARRGPLRSFPHRAGAEFVGERGAGLGFRPLRAVRPEACPARRERPLRYHALPAAAHRFESPCPARQGAWEIGALQGALMDFDEQSP